MSRLPVCDGHRVRRALERFGFVLVRVVGSHHIMRHPGPPQVSVTVPIHGKQPLKRATLTAVIKQSKVPFEDFLARL